MPAQDLLFQQLSTPQNNQMQTPPTIASAATITPTTLVTVVSGAVAIVNIIPPIDGAHLLIFIPTGAFTMTAAGNIANTLAGVVVNVPVFLVYNPITKKYHAGHLVNA